VNESAKTIGNRIGYRIGNFAWYWSRYWNWQNSGIGTSLIHNQILLNMA